MAKLTIIIGIFALWPLAFGSVVAKETRRLGTNPFKKTLAPPLTQKYSVRLHLLSESASCVAYRLCKSTKGQGGFEKNELCTMVKAVCCCCPQFFSDKLSTPREHDARANIVGTGIFRGYEIGI